MNGKDLYDAVEFVGHDLIDLAEKRRFTRPFWQTALPVAAMIALLLGVGITLPRPVPAPDNKTLAECCTENLQPDMPGAESQPRSRWLPEKI